MNKTKEISPYKFEKLYEQCKEIAPESDDEFIAALTSSMMLEEDLFVRLSVHEYDVLSNGLDVSIDKPVKFCEYMYYMINYGYKSLVVVK